MANEKNMDIASREKEKIQNAGKTKNVYSHIFHREVWIQKRLPFAKDWLLKNDKEWFEVNKDAKTMNETFRNYED